MLNLTGQSVLVTGGAKRIGAAICEDLASAGCDVVVHYSTSSSDAKALASRLADEYDVRTATARADLRDVEAADALVHEATDALGSSLDLLVNNASAFPPQPWKSATYEDVDAMMRIHAWAPFTAARALSEQGGQAVVNLVDTRITDDDPQHGPYLLSKQALWHLTADMARQFTPMRVNAVAPGPILPPSSGDAPDADFEAARKATILGRVGTPEHVASTVRFLLQNDYITGDTVFVDGGRHLR